MSDAEADAWSADIADEPTRSEGFVGLGGADNPRWAYGLPPEIDALPPRRRRAGSPALVLVEPSHELLKRFGNVDLFFPQSSVHRCGHSASLG